MQIRLKHYRYTNQTKMPELLSILILNRSFNLNYNKNHIVGREMVVLYVFQQI